MKTIQQLLIELNDCKESREYTNNLTLEEIIDNCHRGDWLLWLAKKVDMDLRLLTLAKARCAKTVIHLMKFKKSIDAVNVAEQFGLGKATRGELDAAAYDSRYTSYYPYAAADSAYYAADAYSDYSNHVAYYTAEAAYNDAYNNSDNPYFAVSDAAAARIKNQKKTAQICRDTFRNELIELVNKRLQ
jgi:hypothetical protein